MSGSKFYVVWNGVETGVYDSWEDVKPLVTGYPGARYKGFPTRAAAVEAYRGDPAEHLGLLRSIAGHSARTVNYEAFPEIRLDAIAVDAACSRNPGPVEYQGVAVGTGERIFHVGPLEGGTNNIGEFLALVHVLALLDKNGRYDIPVYTDSRTGLSWVRNRSPRTTVVPTAQNAAVMELLRRATAWLQSHQIKNPIFKWDTERWGEIPADFGRK